MNLLLGALIISVSSVLGKYGSPATAFVAQDATSGIYNIPETSGQAALKLELASVTGNSYTTLAHSAFPKHSVRITRARDFCDATVKYVSPYPPFSCVPWGYILNDLGRAYSGYVDVEARHLFFYFFESRNDPDTDDVVMWINGGTHTIFQVSFWSLTLLQS